MTARLARWSLLLLIVLVLAVWLPQLWNLVFEYRYGKTKLFYSPVREDFVYTELLGEGHDFIYRDRAGSDYTREEFEALIPFIYYKNMELWGRLPLELAGQRFDKAAIRAERQVMALDPVELPSHAPRVELFPLLESNPGRARLRFPENAFRGGERLEFINSDANRLDPDLTARFTEALAERGFAFPVQAIFGRVSILKAFDAGYFLIDDGGGLFHLKRVDGEPWVNPVALPDGLEVRHIKVAENKRREFLGFLLAEDDRLYLLGDGDYRLVPLPLPGYDSDRMELKIIFNPLYRTAIYSDQEQIHAVAMDRDFEVIALYQRTMAMARPRLVDRLWETLTPYGLSLREPESRYVALSPRLHPAPGAAIGIGLSLILAYLFLRRRGQSLRASAVDLIIVALSGLYGLIAVLVLPPDRRTAG